MDQKIKDEIERIVADYIGMTAEQHKSDHDFDREVIAPYIRRRIIQIERREDLYQKIMGNVFAAMLLGALGWLGTVVYHSLTGHK